MIQNGIIYIHEYKKENNIPNKDNPIIESTFLNSVFNNNGINSQPIIIKITIKILNDPLTRLSRKLCIKIMILLFKIPNFLAKITNNNTVNWTFGIRDKTCSIAKSIAVKIAIIAISQTLNTFLFFTILL